MIDPAADDDGDGMTNSAEDIAATNPFSSSSVLRVTALVRTPPSTLTVTWSSVASKSYQLESAASPSGTYTSVGGVVIAAGASTTEAVTAVTPAFYRVRVVP